MVETGFDLLGEYGCYSLAERINQCINLSCPGFPEKGFDLGEDQFYRVEIRGVGRQVGEEATRAFYQFSHVFVVVDGEVVHEDNLPRSQGRNKHLTQVGKESFGVDRARVDQALLSVESSRCHCGDKADLTFPASRCIIDCTLTFQRAGVAAQQT